MQTNEAFLNRRRFLGGTLATGLALGQAPSLRAAGGDPSRKLRVATLGLGRGKSHLRSFVELGDVEIAYVCDVDERRIAEALRALEGRQEKAPQGVKDFRRILEDKDVDAVSIAMPNFWHAPAAILACQAGKHVYVEKPGSHNAREGEWIVAAARKYGRVVQMGNQRRSFPGIIEGIAKLREGAIGPVRFSRCWYNNARPGIGKGQPGPIPDWLDWELWQGPTPEMPFKDNLVHYNWHWHWHYGGGELANNGIHALDLARWGLDVTYPKRVTYLGGRYHYDDDQETPDTGVVIYDFGDKGASWEHSSCNPRRHETRAFVSFYGDEGTLEMSSMGYQIFDLKGKEVAGNPGTASDVPHFRNFVDCIRNGGTPNSDIAEGQISTLWCHLGNIALRSGGALDVDPTNGHILNNPTAMQYWGRDYRYGWAPRV